MKRLSLICAFACILFTCCKKSNKTASKTDILTSGTWKTSALHYDGDGDGTFETDEYSGFPSCVQDNFFTFKSGGEFITDEGTSKCDPSDAQTQSSDWSFSQNETKLTIDGDVYIIEELTSTTLRIKSEVASYGVEITLVKR